MDNDCKVHGCNEPQEKGTVLCASHYQEFDYFWCQESVPGLEPSPIHFDMWLEIKKKELLE